MNAAVQGNPHATDAGLSLDRASKPNMDLTQPADVHIIKQLIGWGKMDAAAPKVFQQDAQPGQSYSDFKSGYYQNYDPRAFGFSGMTPDERAQLKTSLGPPGPNNAAYQKFLHSYQVAKGAGVLAPPAQAGAQ
jgi:hypothetical protein